MDDAITFIETPNRSLVAGGSFPESNENTVVSLALPLVVRSSAPLVPPLHFVNTIQSASVRGNHKLAFLLWVLNSSSEDLRLTLAIGECAAPFQLFKSCFESHQAPDYETFLQVRVCSTPNATKTTRPYYQVSVFPQILQTIKVDQFKTEYLLRQYTQQFVRILDSYKFREHPSSATYLGVNVSRLLQCYVNDTIYDTVYKWRHWNKILGHQVTFAPFSQLVAKFWDSYLAFQVGGLLSDFTAKFRHFGCVQADSSIRNLRSHCPARPKGATLKYGIWIDSVQGVLVLSNMATAELMDPIPSLVLDLTVSDCERNVKKLLLFLNCCLIECVSQELSKAEC
ncbi:LAME_0F06238g1_1 [Lachancea meyersii CBS 8951]|uniref:LAME_0F06238g1_1 n=1 Tax=Lachancea meyersii CBS 8951 TaxID=1266667 RepID=A0A1G4JTE0_9SACH|nr:LAME_0F06238g1_1 [Lachancea meyersii CBS 8951]